jgi:hypothetical protein
MTEGFRRVHHSQQNFLSGTVKNVEFLKKLKLFFCFNDAFSAVSEIKNSHQNGQVCKNGSWLKP